MSDKGLVSDMTEDSRCLPMGGACPAFGEVIVELTVDPSAESLLSSLVGLLGLIRPDCSSRAFFEEKLMLLVIKAGGNGGGPLGNRKLSLPVKDKLLGSRCGSESGDF